MYCIVGNYEKIVKDLWIGKKHCPHCGEIADFHLMRNVRYGTAFSIPVMSVTANRYIECDSCGSMEEIKRKDFKMIRNERERSMEKGRFPEEIIKEDFSPEELKFHWRIVKLVIAALWAVICVFTMVGTVSSVDIKTAEDIVMSIVWIAVLLLMMLPCVFACKNFVRENKKRKVYKNMIK